MINETFEGGCIIKEVENTYIVTLLYKYSEYDGEIPQISETVRLQSEEDPTIGAACSALKRFGAKDNEWVEIGDRFWELYNEHHESGDPLWYQVTIQTPEQHQEMINGFTSKIRSRAIPAEGDGE